MCVNKRSLNWKTYKVKKGLYTINAKLTFTIGKQT